MSLSFYSDNKVSMGFFAAIDCNWGRYLALSKNGQYNQFGAGTAADFEFESLMTELKTKAAIEISKFDVTGSILEGTNLMKEVCRLTAGPKKNSIQRPRGESNAHEIKIDIEQEWISAEQNFEVKLSFHFFSLAHKSKKTCLLRSFYYGALTILHKIIYRY